MKLRTRVTELPSPGPAVRPARLKVSLGLLFVGAGALALWFLIGPTLGTGHYYGSLLNRSTYGYNKPVMLLFVPYGLALFAWWRGSRVPVWGLFAGAVALHLLFLFPPPPQSQDFYQYLFYGKMQALYHANPYVVHPSVYYQNSWYALIRWPNQTSVYGPAWTAICALVAKVAGNNLPLAYVLLKLVVFGADVSIMTMIVKASKDRTDRDDAAGWGLLAYAWNPLILMTVPLGGMADVAIAAAFIGALLARRRGRTGVATVLLTLASLIKVYAAIGLLLHLVLLARERKWKVASRHAAVAAALAAAAYAPYWAGLKTFRAVLNVANLTNHSLMGTLQRLLVPVFQATGFADPINDAAAAVRWLAAPLLLGVVIWTVAKVRSEPELWHGVLIVLAAYTYLTPWYLYWYIVAPLALVAVLPRNRLTAPLLTFSATTLILVRFPPWLLGQVAQTLIRYVPPVFLFLRERDLPLIQPIPQLIRMPQPKPCHPRQAVHEAGRFVTMI